MLSTLRLAILLLLLVLPECASASKARGAFWRSLLLPGWGQHYASGGGTRFFAAELAFWGSYLAFERLEDIRREQYRAYAAERARANPNGKSGEYFDDLGFYQSRLLHNQFALYEDGVNAAVYPLSRDFFWEWDHTASRERYRSLRNSSSTAGRQAVFTTGLIVVNHLVSAVHAARIAAGGDETRTDVVPSFHRGPFAVSLTLIRRF